VRRGLLQPHRQRDRGVVDAVGPAARPRLRLGLRRFLVVQMLVGLRLRLRLGV
jgi:hypothetical protein